MVILDTARYKDERVHVFRDAGLGAVTDANIFDIVCYMNELVHAF